MPTLINALTEAVKACNSPTKEEEGGVILFNKDDYRFVKLSNVNSGETLAAVLWTADRNEYAAQVIPLFKDGWKHYASFHTHPNFPPFPSGIDRFNLFPGFPVNFIYSPLYKMVVEYFYPQADNKLSLSQGKAYSTIDIEHSCTLIDDIAEYVKLNRPVEEEQEAAIS